MSDRSKVIKFCIENDIRIYDHSIPKREVSITLWTPKGTRFKALGTHSSKVFFWPDPSYTKEEGWKELLEDISGGLEDCDDPKCDSCNDPEPLMPSEY